MNPNHVIVDLDAIHANFCELRRAARPAELIAVIKSDAYGHGIVETARVLDAAGAAYLAVAHVEELKLLRDAGLRQKVILLPGIIPSEAEEVIALDGTVALFRSDVAEALAAAAGKLHCRAKVHIKIDTGMSRLGVHPDDFPSFLRFCSTLPALDACGAFSHFAVADAPELDMTARQLSVFSETVAPYRERLPELHVANSGGVLTGQGIQFPLARTGISLYGSPPASGWSAPLALTEAMSVATELISVKWIAPGSTVSYGCTHTCRAPTRIGVIPFGYDDGYPRQLSNRGIALVRGQRAPVIGRVCMNLTMLDVTAVPDVRLGDEVILLGRQKGERISADEAADLADTISYDLYCRFGHLNRRDYIGGTGSADQ